MQFIGRSASEASGCVPWPGSRRASHSSDASVDSSRVDTLDGRQAFGSSGCFELRRPQVNSGDHIQVGRRSIEVERDHRWHGPLIFPDRRIRPPTSRHVRVVVHQCGFLGCRVGEASNPGPVQTRQARRLERSRRGGLESTQVDSSEETLDRPNRGRHVVPRILASGTVGDPRIDRQFQHHRRISLQWGLQTWTHHMADAEIAEVARRDLGGIQSRSDHVPVVAMDVNDSESEVSMGTALELDLAASPWDVTQAEFQNVRRVQGDHDAPREAVERTDVWCRPSRRVALIPGSEGGTPRSIQDRVDSSQYSASKRFRRSDDCTGKLRCNAKVGVGSFTTHGAHVGGGSGDGQTNH